MPDHLATSPIPLEESLFEEGMKELHGQKIRHVRSETESSRESEAGSKTISSTSLRASSSQPVIRDIGIDMNSVEEKLSDMSIELPGPGKAKEKKLTKTKASLKALDDVEAGSSQEEDSTSKLDQRLSSGSHHSESITIETETGNSNSRSRVRAKRRRRKSGKGSKSDKSLPQNMNVRRLTMSESSTSSSQHSDDEEMEGIFPIDDVDDDDHAGDDGNEEDRGQMGHPVSLIDSELVSQNEWGNLNKSTQRFVFSDGDYTPVVR